MKALLLFLVACISLNAQGQMDADTTLVKAQLDSLNRVIDRAVVKKDTQLLKMLYAGDFRFLHSTGRVDDRASWLRSVSNPTNVMQSREHDSIDVELHGNMALVAGTLSVKFPPGSTRRPYAVRYIRLYALQQDGWKLVSHRSTAEWRY